MGSDLSDSRFRTFHVACQFTGKHVCYCRPGMPAGVPSDYGMRAKLAWQAWTNQAKLFDFPPGATVEISLPKLLRRTKPYKEPDSDPEASLQAKKEAENALKRATRAAETAIAKAAKQAAAAGLEYTPPAGFDVDLKGINKELNVKQVEEELRAARKAVEEVKEAERCAHAERLARERAAQQEAASQAEREQVQRDNAKRKAEEMQQSKTKRRRTQPSTPSQSRPLLIMRANDDADDGPLFTRMPMPSPSGGTRGGSARSVPQDSDSIHGSPRIGSAGLFRQPSTTPRQQKRDLQKGPDGPDKNLLLKMKDVTSDLLHRRLQLYWDDGIWWPAEVTSVNVRQRKMNLLYDTGDKEDNCNLAELIAKGEVAFLDDVTISDDSDTEGPREPPPSLSAHRSGHSANAGPKRRGGYSGAMQGPMGSTMRGGSAGPVRGPNPPGFNRTPPAHLPPQRESTISALRTLITMGDNALHATVRYKGSADFKWRDALVLRVDGQKRTINLEMKDDGQRLLLAHANAGIEYALEFPQKKK